MRLPRKCKHTILSKSCEYCVALKGKWYEKLKKVEFEDIERDEDTIKAYSSDTFRRRNVDNQAGGWQVKAEYYYMATQFLNEYKFNTKMEQIIWEYHAEGIGAEDIAKTLKSMDFKKYTNKIAVTNIIKRLKNKMFDMYMAPKKEYHEPRG